MTQRHDRDTALAKAMTLFWQRGFHGTSLKDLEQHLAMHPGSIYSAFGSKAGLYCRAMEFYAEQLMVQQQRQLKMSESVLEALARSVREIQPVANGTAPMPVCFLNLALMETGIQDAEVITTRSRLILAAEEGLATAFRQAKANREIAQTADCEALAQSLQAALAGISLFALRPERQHVAAQMIANLVIQIRGLGQLENPRLGQMPA